MAFFFQRKTRGARLQGNKNTKDKPLVTMPAPDRVWIAMNQHAGLFCEVLVRKGDTVTVGQRIGQCDAAMGVPIYSSVSGEVAAFDEIVLPDGERVAAIAIDADKKQTLCPDLKPPTITDHASLVAATQTAGMVGLGGAGFPTHVKLNPPNLEQVDTLLINAAECEPFLCADNRAILENTKEIFCAIDTILQHTGIEQCIIAIENNKPEAIELLHRTAQQGYPYVSLVVLPTIYPQGAERMIIDQALGRIVPEGKLPADVGCIVINVTTAAELGHLFKTGIPLVAKKVTVDGNAIRNPQNITAPIGTSIKDIAEFCGGYLNEPHKILMGGPMMGMTIYDESYPLLINNNGLLFFDEEQTFCYEETACIACGRCTRACPMHLMPFHLKRAREREDVEGLLEYKIGLCIECGSCSYVCPARQDLVQSHRMSKRMVKAHRQKESAQMKEEVSE